MTSMTVQVPDDLAKRVQSFSSWFPTIIELSLAGFKTLASAGAAEVTEFLSQNPSPHEVLSFHASEESQARLRRLLALNAEGMLSNSEQLELDELQQLEHIVVMLKAQVGKQLKTQS